MEEVDFESRKKALFELEGRDKESKWKGPH
jgi:hypothetical protein